MPSYTAMVTLLAVLLYFVMATRVAAARSRFKVVHPATTGNPDFERVFRAHINTLEWMPIFLPTLWIAAFYFSDRRRGGRRVAVDHRTYPVLHRLQQGGREAGAGLPRSVCRLRVADDRRGRGDRDAFVTGVRRRNIQACPWSTSRPSAGRRRRRSISPR